MIALPSGKAGAVQIYIALAGPHGAICLQLAHSLRDPSLNLQMN